MSTTDPATEPVELVPLPLRLAAILSGVVGVVTIVVAAANAISRSGGAAQGTAATVVGIAAGVALCLGAALVFHRRRLGAAIVVGACLLPTVVGVFTTGRVHSPALLLVLATVAVLANWRLLR